jgi:sulfide:quinone oxidoreductase
MAGSSERANLVLMAATPRQKRHGGLRVLVAGGGVAGLETLLALRALAGDLVDLELLAPESQFWYRPLAVAEPFGLARAEHFDLGGIADSVGATFTLDRLASVDSAEHIARTAHGAEIVYDVLVIACGALPRPALPGALSFRGPADKDAFGSLLAEAESGSVSSIAFAVPAAGVWPLPLYELALMTAAHVAQRGKEVRLELVTPEPSPLALFGVAASNAVEALLAAHAIKLHAAAYPVRYERGRLELVPAATIRADRAVALPRLEGLRILGLPQDDQAGRTRRSAGRCRRRVDRPPSRSRDHTAPVPSRPPRAPPNRLCTPLPPKRTVRRPRRDEHDHERDTLVATRKDRRPLPRALPR